MYDTIFSKKPNNKKTILLRAKDLNRPSIKEDITANKHLKKCPASLANR